MQRRRSPKPSARRQAADAVASKTLLKALEDNLRRASEPALIARLRAALEKLKDGGERA
jgi:hypothetical protein